VSTSLAPRSASGSALDRVPVVDRHVVTGLQQAFDERVAHASGADPPDARRHLGVSHSLSQLDWQSVAILPLSSGPSQYRDMGAALRLVAPSKVDSEIANGYTAASPCRPRGSALARNVPQSTARGAGTGPVEDRDDHRQWSNNERGWRSGS